MERKQFDGVELGAFWLGQDGKMSGKIGNTRACLIAVKPEHRRSENAPTHRLYVFPQSEEDRAKAKAARENRQARDPGSDDDAPF